MEIQKIFSEIDTDEMLYSVLMDEDEYRLFATLKYDLTDQYKGMKDSDLLAEKKKSNAGTYVRSGKTGVIGAALGGALGAAAGLRSGNVVKGAKAGAAIGGTLGVAGGMAATHKERGNNRFDNRRLNHIQYQAKRREGKDWRSQTSNREGYTY
jgi:hypothetical protein